MEGFSYTYSAKEQEEIKKIRQKYEKKEEGAIDILRRLDREVTQKGTGISIILGVVGCLIMGIGMCCTMVWQGVWFIPGVIVGLIGILFISIAYPVYSKITQKEREKIAPEILRLSNELIK